MVAHLTGGRALPAELLEPILLKTEGVPLFVEELTKTVLESGLVRENQDAYALCRPLAPPAIPATLQDSLMARLDRLAPVKDVAQIAACIGREFDHELLAAVAGRPEAELRSALDQLFIAELVFRRGTPPEATYSFKHALVQDVAYESLLRSRRRQVHAELAAALRQRFPAVAGRQPEVLARHLTEAGLAREAIDSWRAAARQASERSAHREAVSHLRKSLALLDELPASAERDRLELDIRIDLGAALIVIHGYAAKEAEEVYGPAQGLARALADPAPLFAVTWGLWLINQTRLRLPTGRVLMGDMLTLAERASDPEMALQAHHAAWTTLLCVPALAACRKHLEEGLCLYDPERHRAHKYLFGGHDPGVCGLSHLAMTEWLLGFPDQARDHAEHGSRLARSLGHAPSRLIALAMGAYVRRFRGELDRALDLIEEGLQVAIEHGVAPQQEAYARIGQGWARAMTGEVERGLCEIRDGLDRLEEISVQLRRPYQLALLAEVCLVAGRVEEGLRALEAAARHSERWWDPEICRLRGSLVLCEAAHQAGEAERWFRRALATAQAQEARSLQLRAATSLARLWAEQGRRAEAHDVLAPVYGWFTEGFETADLREARVLLEQLQ
jgi:predicted ATPase